MSIYLGNQKVGLAIAPQMVGRVPNLHMLSINADTPWVRSGTWPNLDLLNLTASGQDYIYMTYDANHEASAVSLYITGTDINATIGHLSGTSYVVDATITPSGSNYQLDLTTYTGYKVVRILGTTITKCYCIDYTNANSQKQLALAQPMLERIAYLPHFQNNASSSNTEGTYYLEHDKIMTGPNPALTTLANMWAYCHSLRLVETDGIDTSKVTSMASAFDYCYALGTVDISTWDLSKVTTFNAMFRQCYHLKTITFGGTAAPVATNFADVFNSCYALEYIYGAEHLVTNKATTLSNTFEYCYNLKSVDCVRSWDVTNVTTFYDTFEGCRSVAYIDLSNWTPTKVTNLSYMFNQCYNLLTVQFPTNFNTSLVTNLSYTFQNCYALTEIPGIESWDVGNVTTCTSMFANCYSLRQLNLNNWAPTTKLTTLASMFNACYSLTSVGTLSTWVTSNVTSLASMFSNCWSLTTLPAINTWDLTKVTTIASICTYCESLKEINWPNMNLPACTTMASAFTYCYNLETINLTNLSIPAMTTAPSSFCYYDYNLRNVIGLTLPALNVSFGYCRSLTHQSVMTIINALPDTGGTTRTLNIVTANINRLTAAEKAIATNKGWTLSN